MTPRGAAPLIEMRMAGMRPAGPVWVNLGDFREPDWWRWSNTADHPEIVVRPDDPLDRLDFRCIFGLDVTLFISDYSERAALLFEKLKDYANEICVLSPDFGDDIGFWWLKQYGQIDFNQRYMVTEYETAQAERSVAAHRNNTVAYNAAAEREVKLLKENPWLR
jgi:hypothetical protein